MGLLRYPGGKSRGSILREICSRLIPNLGRVYGEPFFGGGGVGLHLLTRGLVQRMVIAEKDSGLRCLWKDVRDHLDSLRFVCND